MLRKAVLVLVLLGCDSPPPAHPPRLAEVPIDTSPSSAPAPLPPPPEAPPLAPLADATCIVKDDAAGRIFGVAELRVSGRSFAYVDTFDKGELRARAGSADGTLSVTTGGVELVGEVVVPQIPLVPKKEDLRDGWLGVHYAMPSGIDDKGLHLQVSLPWYVKTSASPSFVVACTDVRLAYAPQRAPDKPIYLRPGAKSALTKTPGGAKIGDLSLEKKDAVYPAFELKRSGKSVQVLLDDGGSSGYAFGWIDASAIGTAPPPQEGLGRPTIGGTSGAGGSGGIRCAADVPILVRSDGGILRVGVVKAGTPIAKLDPETETEVPIDIGVRVDAFGSTRKPEIQPFVRKASLAGCS
jgi:hypothetical protein